MPVFLITNAVLALTMDALCSTKVYSAIALENLYPEMMTVPLMQVGKPMLFFKMPEVMEIGRENQKCGY
jgi:hypothetical protein